MDRLTREERKSALEVIMAEGSLKSLWHAQRWLTPVLTRAHRLHELYESECTDDLGTVGNLNRQSKIRQLEGILKARFKEAGLGLYLNGDPRGNPVGILTPKTGRFNTMGGAEDGWRL